MINFLVFLVGFDKVELRVVGERLWVIYIWVDSRSSSVLLSSWLSLCSFLEVFIIRSVRF